MDKKKLTILLSLLAVLIAALVIGLIVFINKTNKQSQQIAETSSLWKTKNKIWLSK